MMHSGDKLEIGIWLDGTEQPEHLEQWKKVDAPGILREVAAQENMTIGPLEFYVKQPGDDRMPQVPDHIAGPEVKLLVAEAVVGGEIQKIERSAGFTHDLTPEDLATLRKITRKAFAVHHPGDRLSNAKCDAIIEYTGPEAAVATLRNGSKVH